jgi:polysaccharide export outer membrane protein
MQRLSTHRFAVLGVLVIGAALAFGHAPRADAQQAQPKPRTSRPTAQPAAPTATTPSTAVPAAATPSVTTAGRPSEPASPPGDLTTPAAPAPVYVDDTKAWEAAAPPPGSSSYALGTGDVVRVSVFQQPDMTTETRVSEAGTITVPLLGPVAVGGGTAKQAEARIAAQLRSRGFVRDPQVNVTLMQFKSKQVSVLGYVSRPGRFALEEGSYRLTDVLALAGGALPDSADVVTLVRVVDGKSRKYDIDLPALFKSGDFSQNPEVIAGDSIYVARAPTFYIYGEVNRPGVYRMEKDMTLMQALSMGGGITLRGTEKNIQIRRRDGSGKYATMAGALTDPLQANDVIFVRESLF